MSKYKIIYDAEHPDLYDSPAGCDRDTKVIVVNPELFNRLTPFQKKFILLHEEGHLALNTSEETSADAYAFDRLAGTEFRSLKQAVGALQEILDGTSPEHKERYDALYDRALSWDAKYMQITNKATGKTFLDWLGIGNSQLKEQKAEQDYNLKMSEQWNYYNLNNNVLSSQPDTAMIVFLVMICVLSYFLLK